IAQGVDLLVNTSSADCAQPSLAPMVDGGFVAAWMEQDTLVRANSWDVFARKFSNGGVGGTVSRLNLQLFGDQYHPEIASIGTNFLATWLSLGQDGWREGVYARYLNGDGLPDGGEFRVNTVTAGPQVEQAVCGD